MAAYVSLVSLLNILNNIQIHPQVSTFLNKNQVRSLREKIDFLLDYVESYNSRGGIRKEDVEELESIISSAAQRAEDVIESHIVDRILALTTHDHGEQSSCLPKQIEGLKQKAIKFQEKILSEVDKFRRPRFLLDMHKILEEMECIKEKVIGVEKERGLKDQQPEYVVPSASIRPLTIGKTTVVGFDGYLVQLLDWLTAGQQCDRRIFPVTGMGGMGKTTLARIVYENSLIVQYFDVRAWVTISQEYDVRKILSEILSCLGDSTSGKESKDQVGEQLHKFLFGRRYLIVLDDMWSIEAWSKIKYFFPENQGTSRIVVTTRQLDVANHLSSLALALDFLDDDRSWDLFCEKAFAGDSCPPELEEIGKKIVKRCKGLPLAIVVIGGLLGKSSTTRKYWETVEKYLSSTLNSIEDNQCLKILSLSYKHLPTYLKPCFLYLGIFPEDCEISVSRLIKLWIAEGFIKPVTKKSWEEVADGYIKELVDRNLILVHELSVNGKVKTCRIHDLLRDLCIRVAEKEKMFCVMRGTDIPRDVDRERRIIISTSIANEDYGNKHFHSLKLTSLVRSIIGQNRRKLLLKPRLLRVIANDSSSLDPTLQKANMRFLENYSCRQDHSSGTYKLPSSISQLWNLQTLIITGRNRKFVAPSEIWEMPQLRHIHSYSIILLDPPRRQDFIVLANLQTLGWVHNFRCSEDVYKRMPNIRKLRINYGEVYALSYYCLNKLGYLNKLESQRYNFQGVSNRDELVQNLRFSSSIKKLTLIGCKLHWDDLTMIGSLPYLEALKLDHSITGSEWNLVEGEFCRLKFLGIYYCDDIIFWNATKSHFPVLENIVFKKLYNLVEIPLSIGDIDTLRGIFLVGCNVSAAISALRILEEQESIGNESIQVEVRFWGKTEPEEFKKQVEIEGFNFPRHNFKMS